MQRKTLTDPVDRLKTQFFQIFCSIRKLLPKTYRMSTIKLSYDQTSRLWLFPKFCENLIFCKGWGAFIKVCAELAHKTVEKIEKFESNRNSRTTEFFVLGYFRSTWEVTCSFLSSDVPLDFSHGNNLLNIEHF